MCLLVIQFRRLQAALARAVADPGEVRACLRPVWLSQLAASRMQQVLDIREPQLVQLLQVRMHRCSLFVTACSTCGVIRGPRERMHCLECA